MVSGIARKDPLVFEYLTLRKAVGVIGVALPFALAIGKNVTQGCGLESTVSSYYYTDVRNIFVGSLCAIGMFLMSCKGYDFTDRILGYAAALFAIGTALAPTAPEGADSSQLAIGKLHLTFAGLLFATFAYFSIFQFMKTSDPEKMTRKKKQRNRVYLVCGLVILGCIVAIGVYKFFGANWGIVQCEPVFWLEAVAIEAFGVSWIVKGEAILKDEESQAA